MTTIPFVAAKVCVALFIAGRGVATAVAQPGKLPEPADPHAASPAVRYESAFADYQPSREPQIRSWQEVNKEVADNAHMGAMGSMKQMPGMHAKAGDAAVSKGGAAGHDMGSMKDMNMPGKGTQAQHAAAVPKKKEKPAGHDMSAMKDKNMLAMAKPQNDTGHPAKAQAARVAGTGVVQRIDKANGRIKLTHDAIAAMGWPRMTLFFRLKDSALADEVKEGDKVQFFLDKSPSGYVISGFQKGVASDGMKQMMRQ